MADPFTIVALIEGSVSLILQCGSVVKTLSEVATKHKQAKLTLVSLIQEVETIEFAWTRIKDWSQSYAQTVAADDVTDSPDLSFLRRLDRSLECGTFVMSALNQDLSDYVGASKKLSLRQRSKIAWNEKALQDHQARIRGQAAAMALLLQVLDLPDPVTRGELIESRVENFRTSDESAYSIVPSRMSSRMSSSTDPRSSYVSIDSADLVYRQLSFEDELFTAAVYKRNYRNTLVSSLFRSRNPMHSLRRTVSHVGQQTVTKNDSRVAVPSIETPASLQATIEDDQSEPVLEIRDEDIVKWLRGEKGDFSLPSAETLEDFPQNLSPRSPELVPRMPARYLDYLTSEDCATLFDPDPTRLLVPDIYMALHSAKDSRDDDQIKSLLIEISNVHKNLSDFGWTSLHSAAFWDDTASTAFLSIPQESVNAEVTKGDAMGLQPLHIAVDKGFIEVVGNLLVGGAAVMHESSKGAPLFVAARKKERTKIMEMLVRFGADVNKRNEQGLTAIQEASRYGCALNVRTLLNFGAKEQGLALAESSLGMAIRCRYVSVIDEILQHDGSQEVRCPQLGQTTQMLLVSGISRFNEVEKAILISLRGCLPGLRADDDEGNQIFHYVAKRALEKDSSMDHESERQLIDELLIARADINAVNAAGHTPLYLAAASMRMWLVELYFEKGSEQLNPRLLGELQAFYASQPTSSKHSEMIQLLMLNNDRDYPGRALERRDIIKSKDKLPPKVKRSIRKRERDRRLWEMTPRRRQWIQGVEESLHERERKKRILGVGQLELERADTASPQERQQRSLQGPKTQEQQWSPQSATASVPLSTAIPTAGIGVVV